MYMLADIGGGGICPLFGPLPVVQPHVAFGHAHGNTRSKRIVVIADHNGQRKFIQPDGFAVEPSPGEIVRQVGQRHGIVNSAGIDGVGALEDGDEIVIRTLAVARLTVVNGQGVAGFQVGVIKIESRSFPRGFFQQRYGGFVITKFIIKQSYIAIHVSVKGILPAIETVDVVDKLFGGSESHGIGSAETGGKLEKVSLYPKCPPGGTFALESFYGGLLLGNPDRGIPAQVVVPHPQIVGLVAQRIAGVLVGRLLREISLV